MTIAPYFIPEELQLKQNAGMIDPVAFAEGELAELRNPSYDLSPKDLARHLALACTMILMSDAALKRKRDDEPTVQEMIDKANREAARWTRDTPNVNPTPHEMFDPANWDLNPGQLVLAKDYPKAHEQPSNQGKRRIPPPGPRPADNYHLMNECG